MRIIGPITLAMMVGCTSETDSFDYQSTLDRSTRGLVLHEDGEIGHAGMLGTNCPFETSEGKVTGDYDLPDNNETIVDSGDLIGENTVLALIGDDAHLLDKSSGNYSHETIVMPGLLDARLYVGGLAGLVDLGDTCEVRWSDDGSAVSAPCGQLDVDPLSGLAVVTGVRGLSVVDRDGAMRVDAADAAVIDGSAEAIYLLEGPNVRALEFDGSLRWELTLDGTVLALAEAGSTGAAAALVGHENGTGELLYLDGDTGAVQARIATPGWAEGLTVSADGSTVALTRPTHTHFYRLAGEWR